MVYVVKFIDDPIVFSFKLENLKINYELFF